MKQFIDYLKKRELLWGSLILTFLLNIGNVINYIFHFSMARFLGPIDYGILAVLTNIIYIFSIPTVSIQTIVSKNTTKYNLRKDYGRIKGVLNNLVKKTLLISLVIFIIFSIVSIYLSKQLKISYFLLEITGVFIFSAFLSPIAIGVLQGMKKFNIWGWNFIISCLFKLILSIILVFLGFAVYGAILGFILGTFLSFIIVFPFIKEIMSSKEIKEDVKIFSKDTLSTFFAIFFVVLIYSIDVILVKVFFDPEIAGKYAIASLLGKIILFGTTAIGNAMFPISNEKYEKGSNSRDLFKKTFLAISLICTISIIAFLLFPELIIKLLFGTKYISIANILLYIGVAFSFVSFLNVFILYKISKNALRTFHIFVLILAFLIQLIILMFMRSSIETFSIGLMFSMIISFILSILLIRK